MEDNMLHHAVRIDHSPEGKVIPFRRGRSITREELWDRFQAGYPGWEHPNGDEFNAWNTRLKVDGFHTDVETRAAKMEALMAWLEAHLDGEFCIAGVFCDGVVSVLFQYQKDMERAATQW